MLLLLAASMLLLHAQRLLVDAATPSVGLVLLFGVLLTLTLAEANRQRRLLESTVRGNAAGRAVAVNSKRRSGSRTRPCRAATCWPAMHALTSPRC
ncbi:MAG: hypothetical protein U5L03_04180 [Burkholderiaceae bacterium]|nr:hypothetical protein [Burkholderiaceae bacterium]